MIFIVVACVHYCMYIFMYHITVLRKPLDDGKKNVKEGLGILVRVDLSGLTALPSE